MAKFETLQEYKDAGYTISPVVGMSNPPTYTVTSPDGEVSKFRPKMKAGKLTRPDPVIPPEGDEAPKKIKKKIKIDGEKAAKDIKEFLKNKNAKGGMINKYKAGGEVKMNKSPNSGMITKRGWGASRKT